MNVKPSNPFKTTIANKVYHLLKTDKVLVRVLDNNGTTKLFEYTTKSFNASKHTVEESFVITNTGQIQELDEFASKYHRITAKLV
ncbi:hypothetical protein OS347_000737 [Vibrio vulnificus]|nr:hypothetical protein [Vibrio vulnificus]